MSVLKFSTYIITSTTAQPFGLAVILAIMSVSTFIAAIILYLMQSLQYRKSGNFGHGFILAPK